MTAYLPPMIRFQPLVAGSPLPGGKVYFYAAGTTTPQAAYAADGTTPLANPLTLDANGATDFRLGAGLSYKINLTDSVGGAVTGWPVDLIDAQDVSWTAAVALVRSDLANTSDAAKGDALIGVKSTLAGGVARTQHEKNADYLSAFDFMTAAQIADVKARTRGQDVTTALQSAIDAAGDYAGGTKTPVTLYLPAGLYKTTARLHMRPYLQIRGDGMGRTTISPTLSSGPALGSDATLSAPNEEEAYLVHHQGFAIDGTYCTGTASAWYFKNNKNSTFTQIGFFNFSGVSAANPPVNIDGACYGLRFVQCQWNQNKSHLKSVGIDALTNFSTTCIFEGCGFEGGLDTTQNETSAGILLKDVLHFQFHQCIIQGNMNYEALRVSNLNSSFGEHLIKDCYFEGNGTSVLPENSGSGVANSAAISLAGVAGKLVTGCIIDGNVFHQAYTNIPNYQIRLAYTDKTRITDNREGFGGTFVKDSGNNTNVFYDNRTSGTGEFGNAITAAAWVNFVGNSTSTPGANCTINDSYNVSSVVFNSAGNYTINFTKAMAKTGYAGVVVCEDTGASGKLLVGAMAVAASTSSCIIYTRAPATDTPTSGRTTSVVIFGK